MLALIGVNPYGWHYFAYLFRAVTLDRPHIGEWAPLWVSCHPRHAVAFALAISLTIWAAVGHGWRNLPGLPLVVITAFSAVLHGRMLPFFSIVWCAHVPAYLEHTSLGRAFAGAWHNHRPTWAILWTVAALALTYSAAQKPALETGRTRNRAAIGRCSLSGGTGRLPQRPEIFRKRLDTV